MAVRSDFPRAQASVSHYFLTLSHGERIRCLAFRPWHLWTFAALAPLAAMLYLAATAYLVFRDDMLAALMRRQTDIQFAYEDRLAAMRAQLDRVTSRKLLDQDSVDDKMQSLVARQAQLETRSSMIALLAENAGVLRDVTSSIPRTPPRPDPKGRPQGKPPAPETKGVGSALGFAPLAPGISFPPIAAEDSKPRPEGLEIGRESLGQKPALRTSQRTGEQIDVAGDPDMPLKLRLGSMGNAMDRLETTQMRTVSSIGGAAKATAQRLRTALLDSGLPADILTAPQRGRTAGAGGPFVPLKLDAKASPFEAEVARLQDELLAADTLQHVLPYLPLRKPVPVIDQTSGFGARVDPFMGKMAMHTGIDLRDRYGAPVRATAAGKIESAGYNGGYGKMVDIDHGNGVVSRYGHMSLIAVSEGQSVRAGDVIGYVGSTGRSTGAHLHYEVRLNDEPVDPNKFLRAGAKVFGEMSAQQAPVKPRG